MHYKKKYIDFEKDTSDKSYAIGGSIIHKIIENHHKKYTDIKKTKEEFNIAWNEKKLNTSLIKDKADNYWNMILNGIDRKIIADEFEYSITFPDFVGIIDAINFSSHEIHDWKSSTRHEDNEKEYRQQMLVYSWLYKRKFGILPKSCTIHYLKYDDSQGSMIVIPTEQDMIETQTLIDKANSIIEGINVHPEKVISCETNCENNYWCPYKTSCFGEKTVFELTLENAQITITKGLTPLLEKGIKKAFSFEDQNAHFIRKNSRWDGIHRLYNERHKSLGIGFLPRLTALIKEYCEYKKLEAEIVINDKRELATNTHEDMPDKFVDGTELRDYQLEAVDAAIEKKVGILGLSVSAGKTTIAAEIIRRLNLPTLFIVDRKELLTQAKERFEKHLKIKIGIIGDSEEDWRPITVATIQTLDKRINNYRTILADVGLLILDECHIGAVETIRKTARQCLNASYRIGMSGSPKRTDGKDMMIEENFGGVIYEMKLAELIERGYATKPVVEFHTVHTVPYNSYEYNEDYKFNVALNVDREKLVLEQVERFKDKKILILVKLVAHGARLHEKIPGSIHIHGSVEKGKRKKEWEEFVKAERGICIATLSIAQKGLDVPSLSVLLNASGHKNETSSLQTIGRIVRKLDGKTATYVDFIDCGKFTRQHSRLRQKTFEDEKHEVKVL